MGKRFKWGKGIGSRRRIRKCKEQGVWFQVGWKGEPKSNKKGSKKGCKRQLRSKVEKQGEQACVVGEVRKGK